MGKKQDAGREEEMMFGEGKRRIWLRSAWDCVREVVSWDLCGEGGGD